MQALVNILDMFDRHAPIDPIDQAKERIADFKMDFENSVFKFARRCVNGELDAINRQMGITAFTLVCEGQQAFIQCADSSKLDISMIEMHLTQLKTGGAEKSSRADMYRRLRNILSFANDVIRQYDISF